MTDITSALITINTLSIFSLILWAGYRNMPVPRSLVALPAGVALVLGAMLLGGNRIHAPIGKSFVTAVDVAATLGVLVVCVLLATRQNRAGLS